MLAKEYGVYSCFHIAHREAWKKYLHNEQKEVNNQIYRKKEGPNDDGIVVVQESRKRGLHDSRDT